MKFIITAPTNGPANIIQAESATGFSSNWVFANTFANRSNDSDTVFRGAISGGLASGKIYMTYLHASETLDVASDVVISPLYKLQTNEIDSNGW